MGLERWTDALNDANKGLEIAERKGKDDIIELLKSKKKQIAEALTAQNDNINNK